MQKKLLSVLLLMMVLLAACAPQATATPAPVEPTVAPTVAPTAEPTAEPVTLTVMAAASLTESFTELGAAFEAAHPGVTVTFNFAGSQQLAEQLAQGAPADVFASANNKQMTAAVDAGRVDDGVAQAFVNNRLVVVVPAGNPAGIETLQDLAQSGIKLVLAAAEVPVGQYSIDFLDKAVQDPAFGADYKDNVLANVVSYEDNVKSVFTKVSLGEADAGIVYSTDITPAEADTVEKIEIPDALNVIATYPIATVNDSANPEVAQAFVDFILSDEAQAVLAGYGFIPAAGSSTAAGPIEIVDALDRTVTFQTAPERIVLVGKALFMIADSIYLFPEAGQKIVAIGTTNQGTGDFIPLIDDNYAAKTILEKDAGAEQVAAAQPDVVILKSSMADSLGTALEQLNIPVVYVDFETPEQYQRDLVTLGKLFNNTARAEELAAYFQGKVDEISGAVADLSDDEKPSTLVLYYSDKDGEIAFNVPPAGWMQTQMIEIAGGSPVWMDANPGNGWATVTLEQIAAWNPEKIFLIAYFANVDDVVAGLKADPQWQALDAVKNGELYAFPGDAYSWDQPDPRWVLGLSWVAAKIHPELYPDFDAVAAAQSFYQDLYGKDQAWFEANISPMLKGDIH